MNAGEPSAAIAIVNELLDALDGGDFERVAELVSDDFETIPVMTGKPMDREAWLRSHEEVHRAFPSFRRNPSGFREVGDEVQVTLHVTGVHDHTVELPSLGIGPIPPTGRELRMPPHLDHFVVRDGRVVSVRSDIPPGGGLKGMLEQIGHPVEAGRKAG